MLTWLPRARRPGRQARNETNSPRASGSSKSGKTLPRSDRSSVVDCGHDSPNRILAVDVAVSDSAKTA